MRRVQRDKLKRVLIIDLLDVKTFQNTTHTMTNHIILGACYTNIKQFLAERFQSVLYNSVFMRIIIERACVC